MEETEPQPKPRNKGGRPKGSKTRPQWLRDALKKQPKRPRGRPKGSKTRTHTVEGLIVHALTPPAPKPDEERKPRKDRKGTKQWVPKHEGYLSVLKREDPERLKEIIQKGIEARAQRSQRDFCVIGKPRGLTKYEWALQVDEARKTVMKIMKNSKVEEALPDNPIARKAMEAAMQMLATEDVNIKDKLSVVRTLLEYNLAKPAATTNLNVKSAEDFLDDLANESA